MSNPYWVLDTDNPNRSIQLTEVPLFLKIDNAYLIDKAPRYTIQCNVCKAHNNDDERWIWPRGTKINGMQDTASNGESIIFDYQCENCLQEYSLQIGKKHGLFLKLFRKDII